MLAAGLEEIRLYPSVSVITDFASADRVYNLRQSAHRAVEAGLLTPGRADGWLRDLEKSSLAGILHCALTAYTVIGKKASSPARYQGTSSRRVV